MTLAQELVERRERAKEARAHARMRNTEQLRAWAERFGKGAITHLARETGLTFAAVSRIVKGLAQPSPENAKAIERATRSEVSAAALLGVASDSAAPDAAA